MWPACAHPQAAHTSKPLLALTFPLQQNFLSSLFLAWTGRLLFQRSFEHIKLRQRDRNTQLPPGPSLWRKIRSLIAREYAVLALFNLVSIACTLMANFYLLRRFITVGLSFSSFISSRIQDTSYLNGFYIFITCVTGQICWHHVIQAASAIGSCAHAITHIYSLGTRVREALHYQIYKKSLRLASIGWSFLNLTLPSHPSVTLVRPARN